MAIAFDTAVNGGFTSGTSHTYSHTCTGSNRILFVEVFTNNSGSDLITGVTYAGVSMSLIAKTSVAIASRYAYLFVLVNPASGANNVVASASSSTAIGANSASYTGANQSGQPDAFTSQVSSTSPTNTSVTTIANNCWAILAVIANSYVPTASTNSTQRVVNSTFTTCKIFDNNGAITPAGSYTMAITSGVSENAGFIMASFAPAATTAVKTAEGLAIASVKTGLGLATASVKTWEGLA